MNNILKDRFLVLKKWSVIVIGIITGGVMQQANSMQRAHCLVHPDIRAFLIREVARNTSLSQIRIAQLQFRQFDGTDPRDMQFHHPPNGKASIEVPDVREFFRQSENDRLIEVPDDELAPELLRRKMLFRSALKHEEGHYYYNHRPSVPWQLATIIAGAAHEYNLVSGIGIPLVFYLWLKGPQYFYERQADAYALRHIDDPAVLRAAGTDYLNTYANQSRRERFMCLFFDEHPCAKSRGLQCIAAAERLEQQRKD